MVKYFDSYGIWSRKFPCGSDDWKESQWHCEVLEGGRWCKIMGDCNSIDVNVWFIDHLRCVHILWIPKCCVQLGTVFCPYIVCSSDWGNHMYANVKYASSYSIIYQSCWDKFTLSKQYYSRILICIVFQYVNP